MFKDCLAFLSASVMKNELEVSNQIYSHTLMDEYTSAIFGIQILLLFQLFLNDWSVFLPKQLNLQ